MSHFGGIKSVYKIKFAFFNHDADTVQLYVHVLMYFLDHAILSLVTTACNSNAGVSTLSRQFQVSHEVCGYVLFHYLKCLAVWSANTYLMSKVSRQGQRNLAILYMIK